MTWVKLDDGFADHPKVVRAGPMAAMLYIRGLCYCARHLTDGFIPEGAVAGLMVGLGPGVEKILVQVKLWERVEGGWQVHHFLDYNPSRAQVLADREAWREKSAAGGRARAASAARKRGRFVTQDQQGHQPTSSRMAGPVAGGVLQARSPSPKKGAGNLSGRRVGAGAPRPPQSATRPSPSQGRASRKEEGSAPLHNAGAQDYTAGQLEAIAGVSLPSRDGRDEPTPASPLSRAGEKMGEADPRLLNRRDDGAPRG